VKPRVLPLKEPDDERLKLLAKTLPGPDGQPLNVFRTLAHKPELARRVNALGGYFVLSGSIPIRDRELVILRVASRCDCAYEAAQHRWIAAASGLSAAEIAAALDPSIDHDWRPADAALLAFADELLSTDTVSSSAWEAVDVADTTCIELLVLVGFYRLLAGVLNGVGVEIDKGVIEHLGGS
jgi:AhpD family alkylhydroperoxidase